MSALDVALADIARTYGAGTVMRLGDPGARVAIEAISTGSIALDRALGIGGMPRGRIVEVFGPESAGKTTVCLHVMAEAQAMGLTVAFIDAEHGLDPLYAESVGVCTDELLLSQPDYGEQALEVTEALIRSGEVGVVVVDSVAALTPKKELDGEMGELGVGQQARMMSQAMRKLVAATHKTNTLLIFTNQIRMKVGVMFGSPETTPGGRALPFYASQRLDVRRVESVGPKGEQTHNLVKVTAKKNKMAAPYREAIVSIRFGEGFDRVGELVDLGVELGLLPKTGGWITLDNSKDSKVNGREAARTWLMDNPDRRASLDREIRKMVTG